MENEQREQEEFIENIKEQFYDEQLSELQGISKISSFIKEQVHPVYANGFKAIKEKHPKFSSISVIKENPFVMKNIVLSTALMLNYKVT